MKKRSSLEWIVSLEYVKNKNAFSSFRVNFATSVYVDWQLESE